jgi:hypothetical protein
LDWHFTGEVSNEDDKNQDANLFVQQHCHATRESLGRFIFLRLLFCKQLSPWPPLRPSFTEAWDFQFLGTAVVATAAAEASCGFPIYDCYSQSIGDLIGHFTRNVENESVNFLVAKITITKAHYVTRKRI